MNSWSICLQIFSIRPGCGSFQSAIEINYQISLRTVQTLDSCIFMRNTYQLQFMHGVSQSFRFPSAGTETQSSILRMFQEDPAMGYPHDWYDWGNLQHIVCMCITYWSLRSNINWKKRHSWNITIGKPSDVLNRNQKQQASQLITPTFSSLRLPWKRMRASDGFLDYHLYMVIDGMA